MTKTIHFLSILAIAVILIGSISVGSVAFADEDDDDEDDDDNNGPKTFESECAKKLDKNKLNLDGLFCQAIIAIQDQLASLSFVQSNPNEPAVEIQVDPTSSEPALSVKEGNTELFVVKHDGSIQIGSNTIIINPDGTVTGGPLFLQAGSEVDGQLISTGPHAVDTTLTESTVDSFVADNGFLSSPVTLAELAFDPATQTELNTHAGDSSAHHAKTISATDLTSGTLDIDRIGQGTITADKMSSSFMKFVRHADDATGNAAGWNPNGSTKLFTITESSIVHTGSKASVVAISLHDNNFSIFSIPTCSVTNIGSNGPFKIGCNNAPTEGAILSYVVLTP